MGGVCEYATGGPSSSAARRAGAEKGSALEMRPWDRECRAPGGSALAARKLSPAVSSRSPPARTRGASKGGQADSGAAGGKSWGSWGAGGDWQRGPRDPARRGDEAEKEKAGGATPPQAAPRAPRGPGGDAHSPEARAPASSAAAAAAAAAAARGAGKALRSRRRVEDARGAQARCLLPPLKLPRWWLSLEGLAAPSWM